MNDEKNLSHSGKPSKSLDSKMSPVQKNLSEKKPKKKHAGETLYYIPLGHSDQNYFFYSKRSRNLLRINTFKTPEIIALAPRSYWKISNPGEKAQQLDTYGIVDSLVRSSLAAGVFDVNKVRGLGVWREGERLVINTGTHVIEDGRITEFSDVCSNYFYMMTGASLAIPHPNPLTAQEGKGFVDVCRKFKWLNPEIDALLLAGWVAVSRIAGALPVRPHIWITGGKGTGKSTLLEGLVNPCLGYAGAKHVFQGMTTEAGIRQTLGNSSLPIVFDEFEITEDKASAKRIGGVLELMRNSWSETSGKIVKGTPGGRAMHFPLNFSACFSSIRVRITNDADVSRISVLELTPHGGNPLQRKELVTAMGSLTELYGERIFARSCLNYRNLLASYEILSQQIAILSSQRKGQQIGMLLSGAWIMQNDHVITVNEAKAWARLFVKNDAAEQHNQNDEEKCLTRLLTWRVNVSDKMEMVQDVILGTGSQNEVAKRALRSFGIIVGPKSFIVASNHLELEMLYEKSPWNGCWNNSLKRLPGAVITKHQTTFGGALKARGVIIPLALIS